MTSETNWVSEAKKALEEIYPDLWDYQHDTSDVYPHNFYILFPKLTVSNDYNKSHTIHELYVKIFFDNDGYLKGLYGIRGRMSPEEHAAGYGFSHLTQGASNGDWGSFCFGEGPLASDIANLSRTGFDTMLFEVVLHSFKIYLEWESIKGGPHVHLSNVYNPRSVPSVENRDKLDYYKRFINKYDYQDFKIQNGKLFVDHTDLDFVRKVTQIVKRKDLVNMNLETGQYYIPRTNPRIPDPKELPFTFKGEKVFMIVDPLLSYINNDKEQFANPKISEYIATRLSRKLTLYAYVKSRTIARKTKGVSICGAVVQDI